MKVIWGVLGLALRLFGLALLVASLACFGFLLAVLAAPEGASALPLGELWMRNDPFAALIGTDSLPALAMAIGRWLHPALWDPLLVAFLVRPSGIALAVLGVVSFAVGALLFNLPRSRRERSRAAPRAEAAPG